MARPTGAVALAVLEYLKGRSATAADLAQHLNLPVEYITQVCYRLRVRGLVAPAGQPLRVPRCRRPIYRYALRAAQPAGASVVSLAHLWMAPA